jgi:hypothetical protein
LKSTTAIAHSACAPRDVWARNAMIEMPVECYSGYRADERPLRFVFRGHEYEVQDLDGQWYSPDATYFRVRAQDGNYYVLRHDIGQDSWTLHGFRAARNNLHLASGSQ